ncbi:MAG TPA: hypothetical protein EYP68_07910 [Candidatus Korarchaeota archaeon]|nr:hypothetical protein [Candidatus Korarchaeota archaeon]
MFDLTRVSYYKYRVVTVAQGQTMEYIISYSVKSGNLEGRSCWIYEIEITNQMTFKYRVWLDKDTFECIKTEMAIGEDIWQTTPCGKVPTGTVEVSEGAKVDIKVIGHETIAVPAGTFSCTVYEVSTKSGKAAYWVADNVPVPVKWETTAEQVTVTGELMEWG